MEKSDKFFTSNKKDIFSSLLVIWSVSWINAWLKTIDSNDNSIRWNCLSKILHFSLLESHLEFVCWVIIVYKQILQQV